MIKTHTGEHVKQEPHTAAECKINEAPHNHPSADCGHFVNEGPGVEKPAPPHNDEQDPEHGPGVEKGAPRHNSDQDPTHGPGVK